jgi:DNA-binding transcriptional LysR family regulator
VALPVDDRGLDVSDVQWVAEAVYLSRERSKVTKPLSIQQVAAAELILPEVRWGDMDPTRRQLLTRAQNAGVSIEPIVEVDSPAAALALAARGVGDTLITLPLAHALGWTKSLYWNSLEPPLHETFAFITRRDAHLSPATQVLIMLAKQRLVQLPHSAVLPGGAH